MSRFKYADLHCHPNLKTFGHSFDKKASSKSDLWQAYPPGLVQRKLHQFTGITKFSQSDFSTMARANARIIFVSLYPFEKGFFINKNIPLQVAAHLADWAIEIGYERVRHLQKHTSYFDDLVDEYHFFTTAPASHLVDGSVHRFKITGSWKEVEGALAEENTIAVIMSIEGGHVFNCGLEDYNLQTDENQILANIKAVKKWEHVPLFMGLAHNFNNGLCGHARSLQRLGKLVNQETNIDQGITPLGLKVIHALLDRKEGPRIIIDLKHMSLRSRLEYYALLETVYTGQNIPLIVSHGAVTGWPLNGNQINSGALDIFNTNDLNFFDEEIVRIAHSRGLFAIQMDAGNSSDKNKLKKHKVFPARSREPLKWSAMIIWNQIRHIAEILDQAGIYAWDVTAIGSDFDGSINPYPGVLTVEGLEPLAEELKVIAEEFLLAGVLSFAKNKEITASEIVDNFMFNNTERFLREFY